MRCVIVANGTLTQKIEIKKNDIIIAADGGTIHCLTQNIYPTIVIGDLDSLTDEAIQEVQKHNTKIIQYPTRKNFTDLELALIHAKDQSADEIIIYGALGARWDQTVANILLPVHFPSISITIIDEYQELHYIHSGHSHMITGERYDTVSLIPLKGDAIGVTTENLEYPLKNETLFFGSSRGVSNRLLSDHAKISLSEGFLLCAVIHHNQSLAGGITHDKE